MLLVEDGVKFPENTKKRRRRKERLCIIEWIDRHRLTTNSAPVAPFNIDVKVSVDKVANTY